jgi:hypothetical protein
MAEPMFPQPITAILLSSLFICFSGPFSGLGGFREAILCNMASDSTVKMIYNSMAFYDARP